MLFPKFRPTFYQNKVYRSIFTNSGSHILSDICDVEDYPLVDSLIQITSGIDHTKPQFYRPFQYSSIEDEEILAVFKKENWNYGRFGDGKTYGVWYSAETEETSLYESSWVAYRLAKDNMLPKNEVYCNERAMYSADISSELAVDLTEEKIFKNQLVHPSDYSYCQALGRKMVEHHYHLLRVPSARKVLGICIPLFSPDPIQHPQRIYYLKINVYPDEMISIHSSQTNFSLKVSDLQVPCST